MPTLRLSDPRFHRLREIHNPPPTLYALGNVEALGLNAIAIVGTRRPSAYGIRAAMAFASTLSRAGFCIVSGLAHGIDAAAHRGALLSGGYTIAVLGHGLDRVYPAENRALAAEIVRRNGCLLSEYPPGVPPFKNHFPARNRIISGLSWGTIVVEAARKSGSLITAMRSVEQGREVFVVPGRYDDEGFSGSHYLVQQGAKLVFSPEHVLEELPPYLFEWPAVPKESTILREIFLSLEGVATLEELSAAGASRAELEAAMQRGAVAEISPQQFAWLENLTPQLAKSETFHKNRG